jgi:hypothetical protein
MARREALSLLKFDPNLELRSNSGIRELLNKKFPQIFKKINL